MASSPPDPKRAEAALRFFAEALATHQRGDLARAEMLYVQVLQADSQHFDALHYLGVLHAQKGNAEAAVRLIGEALQIHGNVPAAQHHMADALQSLGRLDEAITHYDRAIALKPDFARSFLGRARALQDLGRLEDALASFNQALALEPQSVAALCDRGNVLQQLGQAEAALDSYRRAVALAPKHADLHFNIAALLNAMGRQREALAVYDQALACDPTHVESWCSRGTVLQALGRLDEALASHDRALNLRRDHVASHYNRGIVLTQMGRRAEALACYDNAIALFPDYAEAFYNRGIVLHDLGRSTDAVASFDRAIALKENYAEAFYNRGIALYDLRRWEEALASYDSAIAAQPDHASAYHNRGIVLHDLKRVDESLTSYDRAVAINPNAGEAAAGGFSIVSHLCDWEARAVRGADLVARAYAGQPVEPFNLIAAADAPDAQAKAAASYVALFAPPQTPLPRKPRAPSTKLRLVYLSGDFHNHPVGHLAVELFERHDRDAFEIIALSSGPDDGSAVRKRLASAFDHFIDMRGATDEQVAHHIAKIGADIAIDMSGHTKGTRLAALAWRPAPIAVTYLGFPGTTGTSYVDYLIGDPHLIPTETQQFYAEKIAYLPHSYMPNHAGRHIADTIPSRAEAGLPETGFVFCCFNGSYKITREIFDIWINLLHAVPDSVLWFNFSYDRAADNLRREAEARGIAKERLVFAEPKALLDDHLARLQHADIFLDASPYNAHATACDVLWAGIPTVTYSGKGFASRVGGSLLKAIGMPELVTESLADYEALALELARDPALLRATKDRLLRNRGAAPLFNADLYRRHLESAYRMMWERHSAGQPPESFAVAALG